MAKWSAVSYITYVTKSVKPPAELKKKVFSKAQQKSPNFSKGIKAEQIAATYLLGKGYLILERNLGLGNLEIDLIALDQQFQEIVFVEVKYLSSDMQGDPSQAVNQVKIKKMLAVAKIYLKKMQFQKSHRFDIISVVGNLQKPRVEHFENITWLWASTVNNLDGPIV